MQNLWWFVGVSAVGVAGVVYFLGGGSGLSAAQRQEVREACVRWIDEEFADGRFVRVHDSWDRRGRMVVQLLLTEEGKSSGSLMLCVFDPDTGSVLKPSAFDASWHK